MSRVRKLSRLEKLVVLLNLAWLNEAERKEIRELVAQVDGEELYRLAELNAVLPLSLDRLAECNCLGLLPGGLVRRWEERVAPIRERNEKRSEWAGRVLSAMGKAGIEVIVLKGALFADAIYGNRAYKKMNDVDILIRRKDAQGAIGILKSLGFESVGALFGKNELSSKSHHTPPYVSSDLACVIGLHWGLVSPLSPWKPRLEGIWRRKQKATVAGAPAFRMSWEDNLLHLCVHLPFFKTGLRELADVFNLVLASEGGIDWDVLARRARRWRSEDPVYRVLALADALVELGVPSRHWVGWQSRASRLTRSDTALRLARPESILKSRSTQAAKIEKAYAVFALSEKYTERLQAWAGMWAFLLWPKPEELRKISGPRDLGDRVELARARATAPLRIWSAMARDHGHLPLVAMTAVNAGYLAQATLRKIARPGRDGRSLKQHPAARLLEALE